jgi:hypothetical protein
VFIDSNNKTLLTFDTQIKLKKYLTDTYDIIYKRFITIEQWVSTEKELTKRQKSFEELTKKIRKLLEKILLTKEDEPSVGGARSGGGGGGGGGGAASISKEDEEELF